MTKILPVSPVQNSIKKSVKNIAKSRPTINLDLSLEESGFYKIGNKLVKIRFPR